MRACVGEPAREDSADAGRNGARVLEEVHDRVLVRLEREGHRVELRERSGCAHVGEQIGHARTRRPLQAREPVAQAHERRPRGADQGRSQLGWCCGSRHERHVTDRDFSLCEDPESLRVGRLARECVVRSDPGIELCKPGVPSHHHLRRLIEHFREQPPFEIANELPSRLRHSEEGRASKQCTCFRGHRVGCHDQFCTSRKGQATRARRARL